MTSSAGGGEAALGRPDARGSGVSTSKDSLRLYEDPAPIVDLQHAPAPIAAEPGAKMFTINDHRMHFESAKPGPHER